MEAEYRAEYLKEETLWEVYGGGRRILKWI
jgi:hypothetical protein